MGDIAEIACLTRISGENLEKVKYEVMMQLTYLIAEMNNPELVRVRTRLLLGSKKMDVNRCEED